MHSDRTGFLSIHAELLATGIEHTEFRRLCLRDSGFSAESDDGCVVLNLPEACLSEMTRSDSNDRQRLRPGASDLI